MRMAFVLIALILCGPNAAGAAPPAEGDLHGLWKVTSYHKQVVGTDEITMPMGAHPNGFLELRPDHRALYIVTAEDRKPFSKPPTPEEYRDKFMSMSVFAGTYEVAGDNITFHVEVGQFPDWVGTDIRRTLDLQGNVLHYATTPIRMSAPNGKTEEAIFTLTLEKLD
jgi:hypothetical protein